MDHLTVLGLLVILVILMEVVGTVYQTTLVPYVLSVPMDTTLMLMGDA